MYIWKPLNFVVKKLSGKEKHADILKNSLPKENSRQQAVPLRNPHLYRRTHVANTPERLPATPSPPSVPRPRSPCRRALIIRFRCGGRVCSGPGRGERSCRSSLELTGAANSGMTSRGRSRIANFFRRLREFSSGGRERARRVANSGRTGWVSCCVVFGGDYLLLREGIERGCSWVVFFLKSIFLL